MDTREKVLNAVWRLNSEAYEYQSLNTPGNPHKPLKHFTPCAKAEALMAHLRSGKHFGTCHMEAAYTQCVCHPSLTENGLMDYEYDPTWREASERSDYKTMYPRIWK